MIWGPILGAVASSVVGGLLNNERDRSQTREAQRQYGPNATQQLGWNMIQGAAPAANALVGPTHNAYLSALQGGINPYATQMVQAAQNDLAQEFQRNTLPYISNQAQAAGGFGGSRQGVAQGLAAEGLLESMGDVSANILNSAYDVDRRAQLQALQMAPGMVGLGFIPGNAVANAGNQQWSSNQGVPISDPWGSALEGAGAGYRTYTDLFGQPDWGGIFGGGGGNSGGGWSETYTTNNGMLI